MINPITYPTISPKHPPKQPFDEDDVLEGDVFVGLLELRLLDEDVLVWGVLPVGIN